MVSLFHGFLDDKKPRTVIFFVSLVEQSSDQPSQKSLICSSLSSRNFHGINRLFEIHGYPFGILLEILKGALTLHKISLIFLELKCVLKTGFLKISCENGLGLFLGKRGLGFPQDF